MGQIMGRGGGVRGAKKKPATMVTRVLVHQRSDHARIQRNWDEDYADARCRGQQSVPVRTNLLKKVENAHDANRGVHM